MPSFCTRALCPREFSVFQGKKRRTAVASKSRTGEGKRELTKKKKKKDKKRQFIRGRDRVATSECSNGARGGSSASRVHRVRERDPLRSRARRHHSTLLSLSFSLSRVLREGSACLTGERGSSRIAPESRGGENRCYVRAHRAPRAIRDDARCRGELAPVNLNGHVRRGDTRVQRVRDSVRALS